MIYNRRKFGFVIGFMIVIFVSVFMFNSLGTETPEIPDELGAIADERIPTEDSKDETSGEAGAASDGEKEEEKDYTLWNQIKKELNWITMINYTIDVYRNGEGFKSRTTQTISIDAPVVGPITQNVITNSARCGDYVYTTTQAFSNSGYAENSFAYEYIKDGHVYTRTTTKGTTVDAFTDEKEYCRTIEEFLALGTNLPCSFPFKLTSANTEKIALTQNKGKYVIHVRVKDFEDAASLYIGCLEYNGKTSKRPRIVSLEMTFTINPKTGYLEKLERKEEYKVARNIPVIGEIEATARASVTETFSVMDEEVVITPVLP